jgi:hypothetical protein
MGMWVYCLYGHNTTEEIPIGYGPRPMAHWPLSSFRGPCVWTNLLGLPERKLVMLPPDLLSLLYQRFKAANPDGTTIGELEELHARFAPAGKTPQELDELCEQRELFVSLTHQDEDQGYPHLRPYLPELFLSDWLRAIAADPWLDAHLLDKAAATLPADGEACGEITSTGYRVVVPEGRCERWWPQWRMYCDTLAQAGARRGHRGAAS